MKTWKWMLGLLLTLCLLVTAAVSEQAPEEPAPSEPTAISGLKYNGSDQELVNPGTPAAGKKRWFKLDDAAWSDSVPTATDFKEGGYTVTWADTTDETEPTEGGTPITGIEIAKSTITLTWPETMSFEYSGSAPTITPTLDGVCNNEVTVGVSATGVSVGSHDATATLTIETGKESNYNAEVSYTSPYTITPRTVTLTWTDTELTYNGAAQKPTVTVENLVDGDSLAATVTGEQIDAGENYTATASLPEGTVNYVLPAEHTTSYKINPLSIADGTTEPASITEEYTYDGQEKKPAITSVTVSGLSATFDVSYENNVNASENGASVTVTGTGNFTGTITLPFSIDKKDVTVSWTVADYTYDGTEQKPEATLNGVVAEDDCTAVVITEPEGSKNAGDYNATVTSLSGDDAVNYQISGDPTKQYTIAQRIADLSWGEEPLYYNGAEQTPTVTVANLVSGDTCNVTVTAEGGAIHAGTYAAVATGLDNNNYALSASFVPKTFQILSKTVGLTWDPITFVYDGEPHCPEATATGLVGTDVCNVTVSGGGTKTGEYTAEAVSLDNNDYALPEEKTQTFTITAKSIDAEDVIIEDIPDQIYTGSEITPELTITDDTGVLEEGVDFEVAYESNINVGDALVTVTGIGDYSGSRATTFAILPKPLQAAWVSAIPNQIYTGSAIEPTVTITDPDRGVILTEGTDYEVAYEDNINVADKPVVTITGINNYENEFTTTFVIEPKDLGDESIVIAAIADQVYTGSEIMPEVTVTDKAREGAALKKDVDFTVEYSNNIQASVNTEQKAALVTLKGIGNYKGVNGTTFLILRKPVAPIEITVNGPDQDTKRLGGPDASLYHSITIDAEANEAMTVSILDGESALTTIQNVKAGDITISGDAINGAVLDKTGDHPYTIRAEYVDKANLTVSASASADAEAAPTVKDDFVYDMTAKSISVRDLYNRDDRLILTLPEGYRSVSFASSGAKNEFEVSAGNSAAGELTLSFGGAKQMQSTEKYGSSFSGKYEDYVGNAGEYTGGVIHQASGTLEIISVDPPINDAGRIGSTASLTFTVRMSAPGGFSEQVNFFGTRTLSQGEQQISIPTSQIGADSTTTPGMTFDDLTGSAGFQSFIYDPVCDEPILTTEPYSGCRYLVGLAEPYSRITLEVNGQRATATADAYGLFVLSMPITEEGDTITLHVTDPAGNTVTRTYTVGPEAEDVTLTAFMMGHTYTSAHNARGAKPDWTMVLSAKVDDLRAGKVNVPIVAGNMTPVGTISVKLDDNNNLSYSYSMEDGVSVLDEKFIAGTKLDKDAFIAMEGLEIAPGGTYVDNAKGALYLTAKFTVKVPVDMMKDTFQTESIKDNEMKKKYRDLQNGKVD